MPNTLPLEASFKLVWTGVQALMCFKLSPVDSNVQPGGATAWAEVSSASYKLSRFCFSNHMFNTFSHNTPCSLVLINHFLYGLKCSPHHFSSLKIQNLRLNIGTHLGSDCS